MNTAKKISEALVEPQAATSAHPLPQNPAPDAITVAPRRAGQRVEKAPEAFRTISEVAAEIGEEPHVLRFWETKFPALKPIKRAGGRRYYRPEDIEILKRIQKLLRHHNFHIKGAQKLLKGNGLDEVALRQELAEPLTPTPTPTSTPDSNHGAEIPPPADKLSAEAEREKTVGFLSKVLNTISE